MSTLRSLNTTRMRDLVTCSVCLEVLHDPKVLRCLHSFCAQCLVKMGNPHHPTTQDRPTITCPVCQDMSQLPVKGVQGLPNDFKVEQMKDVLEIDRVEGSGWGGGVEGGVAVCDVCRGDESGVPQLAKAHCAQCCVFYCQKCVRRHYSNALFRRHIVTQLTITSKAGYYTFCMQHPGHHVHFLCPTCHHQKAMLCAICVLDHDVTHGVCHVSSAVDGFRTNLRTNLNAVKAKIDCLRKHKEEMADKRCAQENTLCEIREAICFQTLLITAQVDDIKVRLLSEVQEMESTLMAKINEEHINLHLSELVKAEAELEKTLQGSSERCLANYKRVTDSVQKLQAIKILDFAADEYIEFLSNKDTIDPDIIGTLIYNQNVGDGMSYSTDERRDLIIKTERSEEVTSGRNRDTVTVDGMGICRGLNNKEGLTEEHYASRGSVPVNRKDGQRATGSTSRDGFSTDCYTNRGHMQSKESSKKSTTTEESVAKRSITGSSITGSSSCRSKRSSINSSSAKSSSAKGSCADGPSTRRCSSSGCSRPRTVGTQCEACNNKAAVISFYNMKKERLEKLCRYCRALTDTNPDR